MPVISTRSATVAAGLALSLALGGPLVAPAQEATPSTTAVSGPFPTAIYEGTCDNLAAEPSHQLSDVGYGPLTPDSLSGGLDDATPEAAAMAETTGIVPVGSSSTSLDLNVTELFVEDRQHAVVVHGADQDAPVACGNIGGPLFQGVGQTRTTLDEASLLVGLTGQNASGYSGVAWIRSPEGGSTEGLTTIVTVFLLPPEDA